MGLLAICVNASKGQAWNQSVVCDMHVCREVLSQCSSTEQKRYKIILRIDIEGFLLCAFVRKEQYGDIPPKKIEIQ